MKFADFLNDKHWRSAYEKPVTCEGYWSASMQKWDYNDSSILTKLIQEVGRLCDSYASDLFIDWSSLEKRIEKAGYDYTGEVCLFGLRENGVDHNAFIESRMDNYGDYWRYEYRAIYKLVITVEEANHNCDYGVKAKYIKMELGRV